MARSRENEELNKAPGEELGAFSCAERLGCFKWRHFVRCDGSLTNRRGIRMIQDHGCGSVSRVWRASKVIATRGLTLVCGVFGVGLAHGQTCEGWVPNPGPTNNFVGVFAEMPNGDLIAGGRFTTIEGVPANRIARWDGQSWSPLGSGMEGAGNPDVTALLVLPNGDLVAGGWFTIADGAPASRIARWDGTTWSPMGTGVSGGVSELVLLPSGDIVAGARFTRMDLHLCEAWHAGTAHAGTRWAGA